MSVSSLPRRFKWLAKNDKESTHLDLKTGEIYNSGSIGTGILLKWMEAGKIKFVVDEGEQLPKDILLKVQDATIQEKAPEVKNG